MSERPNPIVFILGLWLHKSSWQPWEEFFGQAGYATMAPGWPGDQETVATARANPDSVAKSTFKQYRDSPAVTDIMEFPDRGHSLTIDSGWHEIADAALTRINKQGL
jgi:hypothetical protein